MKDMLHNIGNQQAHPEVAPYQRCITSCRSIAELFRRKGRLKKFDDFCTGHGHELPRVLQKDIPTRFMATFIMIDSFVSNRETLEVCCCQQAQYVLQLSLTILQQYGRSRESRGVLPQNLRQLLGADPHFWGQLFRLQHIGTQYQRVLASLEADKPRLSQAFFLVCQLKAELMAGEILVNAAMDSMAARYSRCEISNRPRTLSAQMDGS